MLASTSIIRIYHDARPSESQINLKR